MIGFIEVLALDLRRRPLERGGRVHDPRPGADLPAHGHPRPAAGGPGMTAATGRVPGGEPGSAIRHAVLTVDRRYDRRSAGIIVSLLPIIGGAPAVQRLRDAERLGRRLRGRGRVRPAGARPERRRRLRGPARPRLRGLLRDRRLHVRLRRVGLHRPAASRSGRCSSSAPLVAAVFGVLLGAPTLRLRGDYLAIVTLGFGEIVPVVFLNADKYTNGTNGITGIAQPNLLGLFGIDGFGFTNPWLVLRHRDGDHHGRRHPAVPAPGFAPRPRVGRDPRGRAGGRQHGHQHGHHEAARVRDRRLDRGPRRRVLRLEAVDR